MRKSKTLNSQTNSQDTPALIFFKGEKKEKVNKEGREFSVLVNLDKVSLKLEQIRDSEDILYMSDGQKLIAKLEFVHNKGDFTIDKLYDFVKNRENTLKCAQLRVRLGIVSLFHSFYLNSDNKIQQAILATIAYKKRISKDLPVIVNHSDKIACLAERRSFATKKLSCMIALFHKDSEFLCRDADQMILKQVNNYKKADFSFDQPSVFNAQKYFTVHLNEKCGMNVLN